MWIHLKFYNLQSGLYETRAIQHWDPVSVGKPDRDQNKTFVVYDEFGGSYDKARAACMDFQNRSFRSITNRPETQTRTNSHSAGVY